MDVLTGIGLVHDQVGDRWSHKVSIVILGEDHTTLADAHKFIDGDSELAIWKKSNIGKPAVEFGPAIIDFGIHWNCPVVKGRK